LKYVDFSIGEDSGYIRFEDSKAAEKARALAAISDEGGLIMKGHLVTLEPVSGQAEKDYWSAIKGGQGKYRDNRSNRGRYFILPQNHSSCLFALLEPILLNIIMHLE
jgi:lupus La protein